MRYKHWIIFNVLALATLFALLTVACTPAPTDDVVTTTTSGLVPSGRGTGDECYDVLGFPEPCPTHAEPATIDVTALLGYHDDRGLDVELAASGAPVVPLSYLIKESQYAIVNGVFYDLFHNKLGYIGAAGNSYLDQDRNNQAWRVNNQRWTFGNNTASVIFTDVVLDPASSEWTYGDTKVASTSQDTHPDASYIFDNCQSDTDLEIDESHTVTLSQKRTTTTQTTIKDDLTTGAKVGGSLFGASLEASVSNTFGWQTDKTRAEEESQDASTSVGIKKTVKAGELLVAVLGSERVVSATPFTAKGPWTGGVGIAIQDGNLYAGGWPHGAANYHQTPLQTAWLTDAKPSGNWHSLHWDNLDDFLSTFSGYNTETPAFTTDNTAPFAAIVSGLSAPDWRWIELTGVQHRTYQSGASYQFSNGQCGDAAKLAAQYAIPTGNVRTS